MADLTTASCKHRLRTSHPTTFPLLPLPPPASLVSLARSRMHRQRYHHVSSPPLSAHTPFHLLPLDFPLSPTTFAHLTTTQLALLWIAPHPDWVERTHWNFLFAEWRKRRRERGREGVERERSGRKGEREDEDPMDRLRLEWKISDKLEELESGPLAVRRLSSPSVP